MIKYHPIFCSFLSSSLLRKWDPWRSTLLTKDWWKGLDIWSPLQDPAEARHCNPELKTYAEYVGVLCTDKKEEISHGREDRVAIRKGVVETSSCRSSTGGILSTIYWKRKLKVRLKVREKTFSLTFMPCFGNSKSIFVLEGKVFKWSWLNVHLLLKKTGWTTELWRKMQGENFSQEHCSKSVEYMIVNVILLMIFKKSKACLLSSVLQADRTTHILEAFMRATSFKTPSKFCSADHIKRFFF